MSKLNIGKDLEDLIKQIALNSFYPVGSVYMTDQNINPSELFGGVWEKQPQGYLFACINTCENHNTGNGALTMAQNGNTGSTAITTAQMPSHTHTPYFKTSWGSEVSRVPVDGYCGPNTAGENLTRVNANNMYTYVEPQYGLLQLYNTGSGQGHTHTLGNHKHEIPYVGFFVWKRTA